jgi:hypothetical protein
MPKAQEPRIRRPQGSAEARRIKLTFKVSAEEEAAIRAYAGARGIAVSEAIREAVLARLPKDRDPK